MKIRKCKDKYKVNDLVFVYESGSGVIIGKILIANNWIYEIALCDSGEIVCHSGSEFYKL